MNAEEFEEDYPDYDSQIEHIESIPAKHADTVEPSEVLDDDISSSLPFNALYSHQAEALDALSDRKNVCVTTPTSSGKTLVYALHIARKLEEDNNSTALLIYPTKALSRDQESELNNLYDKLGMDVDIGVYDGDSSRDEKRHIRRNSDLIITNFQGLNYYLPYHKKWNRIFQNLTTVVIDEAHTYTGVQGMHVAWIVRRLRRLVEFQYNNAQPLFVLSSATIGNPEKHSQNLVGRSKEFEIISEDGSPRGMRDVMVWNPPSYIDEDDGTLQRRSPHRESTDILSYLASNGKQSLMFAPSRKMTELCAKWSEETLNDDYAGFYDVEPYNAGHRKSDRREVENKLKNGELDAVVSTTALELGIDIGDVDVTIMDGYPGRRASFWQQAGRSGRGTNDALSFLVTRHDSIDQYIVNNPEFLLEEDVESAVVDLSNTNVPELHLLAAANERQLDGMDRIPLNGLFADGYLEDAIRSLKKKNLLKGDFSEGISYNGPSRPESNIDLYGTSDDQYTVTIDMGNDSFELPPADKTRAFRDFHPNAIYMYKGNQYEVTEFDRQRKEIKLEYTEVGYYTQASRTKDIENMVAEESINLSDDVTVKKGTATIKESYSTYTRVYFNKDSRESNLPTGLDEPIELNTEIMWIEYSPEAGTDIADSSAVDGLPGSLHAAEHGIIKMSPTVITADKKDIGGLSTPVHPETNKPTIIVYDGVEGGVGFSHGVYDHLQKLSKRTAELLTQCDCDSSHGCPACTMSTMCGSNNEPMDSRGAVKALKLLHGEAIR
jgi:DEAD/DEAH box helicase domain-containing protein